MSESAGKDVAIVIHGAFQSHLNVLQLGTVIRRNGFSDILMPDLAGHGRESPLAKSSEYLPERLSRDIIRKTELIKSHSSQDGGVALLIGHSLGASVALQIALVLREFERVDLWLVEPVFWLGDYCEGQKQLEENLKKHSSSNSTQEEISIYLSERLGKRLSNKEEMNALQKLSALENMHTTLVRGGANQAQPGISTIATFEDGTKLSINVSGWDIGSVIPDTFSNERLFDNEIIIKNAGHNVFMYREFYEAMDANLSRFNS